MQGQTTYSKCYTGCLVDARPAHTLREVQPVDVDVASVLQDTFTTTAASFHTPFTVQRRQGPACAVARAHLPWLAQATTTSADFPHQLPCPLGMAATTAPLIHTSFCGETEYQSEFMEKAGEANVPHSIGVVNEDASLALPWPRLSLGVQLWERGESDHVYCMLPHDVPAPCRAVQVFTLLHAYGETVRLPAAFVCRAFLLPSLSGRMVSLGSARLGFRQWTGILSQDAQAMQATIVIHHGEGSRTEGTEVLGQLDLTGIPPAPQDKPRIQVEFSLSAGNRLSVRVRDLDTQRQKEWLQRGAIKLRGGDAPGSSTHSK